MTWEFHAGQMVVCVDGSPAAYYHRADVRWVAAGEGYTIARVGETPQGTIAVDLEGFPLLRSGYCRFRASRFRPLVTDTQKWLKEVLETPPQPAEREKILWTR